MRAAQPFVPPSPLATELALPNETRRILTQPDMLVIDLRQAVQMPPRPPMGLKPIAVVSPENLLLATKLLPLSSIYMAQDVMENYGLDAYLYRFGPCLTWRARWQVAAYKLAPSGERARSSTLLDPAMLPCPSWGTAPPIAGGASLHDVRMSLQDKLVREVAPATGE